MGLTTSRVQYNVGLLVILVVLLKMECFSFKKVEFKYSSRVFRVEIDGVGKILYI